MVMDANIHIHIVKCYSLILKKKKGVFSKNNSYTKEVEISHGL